MRLSLQRFRLTKAVPLAISRGTTAAVEHLLVRITHDGCTGSGETGGFDTGHRHYATDAVAAELEAIAPGWRPWRPSPFRPWSPCWRPSAPRPAAASI